MKRNFSYAARDQKGFDLPGIPTAGLALPQGNRVNEQSRSPATAGAQSVKYNVAKRLLLVRVWAPAFAGEHKWSFTRLPWVLPATTLTGTDPKPRSALSLLPRRLTVRHRTLTPFIEVRILTGHPAFQSSNAVSRIVAKRRADQLLVDRGLADDAKHAQALILAGSVFRGDRRIAKAGDILPEDAALEVRGRDHPWVSRGGVKLAHGLDHFGWDVTGAVAVDVGSSTGGFTDVLLTRGAARVYAVDSGTNQLAWKLRQDLRVVVLEQTSARVLSAAHIPGPVDLIVCDASFIGLARVLERPLTFAAPGARLMALIKPQFEAARAEVEPGGVVRDPAVHARVCDAVAAWLAGAGWRVEGVTASPITGPEGNIEFLIAGKHAA
jgi:23S rRNA (cytidine1920-2'-O)/16S rRNA (cytidine1409-2'-O)-methyltransferase